MAVVTVQIGQCGNQLGQYIFDTAHENSPQDPYSPLAIHSGSHPFFRPSEDNQAVARAVLVDTEPKVLDICRQRRAPWCYEGRNVVRAGQGGAGNNWAHGYGPVSRKSSQVIMDSIRREAEKADSLEAFMIVHSVAGGTGSGLGTAVTERLQDEYGNTDRLNVVVSPYHSGEVIVQNYNAVLTLGHLATASDAVLMLENEHVNRICTKLLNVTRPGLGDLNTVLSAHISPFILPVSTAPTGCIRDSISALCAHPGYNMLTARIAPQTPAQSVHFDIESWVGMLRRLKQMHLSGVYADCDVDWSVKRPLHRAVANILTLRGLGCHEPWTEEFLSLDMYAEWSRGVQDGCIVRRCPCPFSRHEKSASMISNSQAVLGPLQRISSRAQGMFECQAFLHQYMKYGTEAEDFEAAFLSVEQVMTNYSRMC